MNGTAAGYYPVMLQLKGRNCFVVGGGKIATRKIEGLVEAGANRITVISPMVTDQLAGLIESGTVHWIKQQYSESCIQDAFIVFAATNNVELNDRINVTMEQCGILVCNVSKGQTGSFITPAVIYEDDVTIAISTGGGAPALTREIKKEIQEHISSKYKATLTRLSFIRTQIIAGISEVQLKEAMLALALEDCLEQREIEGSVWYDSLLERCTNQLEQRMTLKGEVFDGIESH